MTVHAVVSAGTWLGLIVSLFVAMFAIKKLHGKNTIACILMCVIFFLLLAIEATRYTAPSTQIHRFRSKQHLREITKAFQLELAPSETLYVSYFSDNIQGRGLSLSVCVRDILSAEDFLSRIHSDIQEIDNLQAALFTLPPDTTMQIVGTYDINSFSPIPEFSGRRIQNTLTLFSNEDSAYAILVVVIPAYTPEEGAKYIPIPAEFETMVDILRQYLLPSRAVSYPFVFIQAVVVIYVIFVNVRHKIRTKKPPNEQ